MASPQQLAALQALAGPEEEKKTGASITQITELDRIVAAPDVSPGPGFQRPPDNPPGFRAAPIDTSEAGFSDFEVADVGRGISNITGEASDLSGGLGSLFSAFKQQPLETVKALSKREFEMFNAVPEALFERLGIKPRKVAGLKEGRDIVKSIIDEPRKTVVEFPISTALTIAGLSPLASFGRIVKGAEAGGFFRGAAGGRNNFIAGTEEFFAKRLGKGAGVGSGAALEALEAGREGGAALKRFAQARKKKITPSDIAEEIIEDVREARKMTSIGFQEDTKFLKQRRGGIQPFEVRKEVHALLKEEKVRVGVDDSGNLVLNPKGSVYEAVDHGLTAEGEFLAKAVKLLDGWVDNSVDGSHTIQRRLDKIIPNSVRQDNKDAMRVLTGIREKLTDHLKDRVELYAERAATFRAGAQFIEGVEKTFGLTSKTGGVLEDVGIITRQNFVDDNVLTKSGQVLNDRLNKNLDTKVKMVNELDRVIEAKRLKERGIDTRNMDGEDIQALAKTQGVESTLIPEMAGVRLSESFPQGIAGSLGQGGMLGGGMGTTAGAITLAATKSTETALITSALFSMVGTFVIRNPRAVGRFLSTLGASSKVAKRAMDAVEKARVATLAAGMTADVGFTDAVMRLQEDKPRTAEDILKTFFGP